MKLSEILTESQTLNEAPMGMLKRGALGLASKFSSKATGKLAAGNEANALRKDFDFWLGSTNQKASINTLRQFLKQEGHPTDSAEQILKSLEQKSAQAAPTTTVAPAAAGTTTPSSANTTKPAAGTAAKVNPATDPYERFKGEVRKLQTPQSGAKPLPPEMIAKVEADIAKLAKGDKESGSAAAQKLMNFAKQGYDVSKLAPKWAGSSKAGERFLTQGVYRAIDNLLKEYKLSWNSIGISARIVENFSQGVFISMLNENVPLTSKDIDQVMTAVSRDIMKMGGSAKPQAAPAATTGAPTSNAAASTTSTAQPTSFNQIKPMIDKLSDRDKQELIDYLKKNDRYQKLKF